MKLLTQALKKILAREWDRPDEDKTNMAYAKFFNPGGVGTWYVMEMDPATDTFYGYAHIHEWEFGYFSLAELTSFRNRLGLPLERDLYFEPTHIDEIKKKHQPERYGGTLN